MQGVHSARLLYGALEIGKRMTVRSILSAQLSTPVGVTMCCALCSVNVVIQAVCVELRMSSQMVDSTARSRPSDSTSARDTEHSKKSSDVP